MQLMAITLSNILSVLLFIIIICFLIAWHELGHLLVAKKCNVYCYEYSIGFGPILYRSKKHETHFCIRAIPLGGFVRMAGEDGVEDGEEVTGNDGKPIPKDRIFGNKKPGPRALILAAGGLMNIIFALLCFYFYVSFNDISSINGKEGSTGFAFQSSQNIVLIGDNYPLQDAGMETGDRIVKVKTYLVSNGSSSKVEEYEIKKFNDIMDAFDSYRPSKLNEEQFLTITYVDATDNSQKEITVSRKSYIQVNEDGSKSLGVELIGLSQGYEVYEYNALTGLYGSFHFLGLYTVEMFKAFGQLFTGNFENLSGLVGIYQTVDDVASAPTINFAAKLLNIVYIAGAISFSLGFFNLIPFPALDGGRLFFVILEAIRHKKVSPNTEALIHFVGLILLFILMIVVNIKDIIKLF